ncbi:MAG: RsmE family RNA methyltransferase [Clostridia bacterium]
MYRFFIDGHNENNEATLSKSDSAHAFLVLRLRVGDEIVAVERGVELTAIITAASKSEVKISITGEKLVDTEPKTAITLFQCIPKFDKFELIIQKSIELGVFSIIPVRAARCVKRLEDDDVKNKLERFNKIAYEASKQSRRGIVPNIAAPVDLKNINFSEMNFDSVLLAYEGERDRSLKDALKALKDPKSLAIFIGPEGGMNRDEVSFLTDQFCIPVSLGKRILRTETAGIAMLASCLYELEGEL